MGLLKFLNDSEDARKVFGARELKIIEKQLMGVALTQSEKNRLSRDIRKKLDFISKIARFEPDFRLKKGAEVTSVIEDTKDIILADEYSKNVKKIFIYGSAAENSRTLRSDIDIAVSMGETSKADATMFRKRVLGKSNNIIDVQVFETLPEKVQKEILRTGKIIYPA